MNTPNYQTRVELVHAIQFQTNGVAELNRRGTKGETVPYVKGDWLITTTTGYQSIISDKEFSATYIERTRSAADYEREINNLRRQLEAVARSEADKFPWPVIRPGTSLTT